MSSYNKVILMGNLTRDPDLRFTASNTAVAKLGLAVNDRYKDRDGNWQDKANFIDCVAFGRTAEVINEHFAKGRPILIEGKLSFSSWDDKQSGQKRSKLEVIIDSFEFVGDRGEMTEQRQPVVSGGRPPIDEDSIPFHPSPGYLI